MLSASLSNLIKSTTNTVKGQLVNIGRSGTKVVFEIKTADSKIYKVSATSSQAAIIVKTLNLSQNIVAAALGPGISDELRSNLISDKIFVEIPVEKSISGSEASVLSGGERKSSRIENPTTTKGKAEDEKKEKEDLTTVYPTDNWPGLMEESRFLPVKVPGILGTSNTRIGHAVFSAPIQFFTSQRTSYIEQSPTLRESGSIKKGTGLAFQTYTINYFATDAEEVRTSVKEVFDQLLLLPFISCQGGPFGFTPGDGDIPYHDFAVRSYSLATVPGHPSVLNVQISLEPLLFDIYCQVKDCKESQSGYQVTMDDIVCWPLVKLWTGSNEKSTYNPILTTLNGSLRMSLPSKKVINRIVDEADKFKSTLLNTEVDTLETLKILITEPRGAAISSNNAKLVESEVLAGSGRKIAVVKFEDQFNYSSLQQNSQFLGLVRWEKFSGNRFSSNGTFLPQSGTVNLDRSSSFVTNQVGITNYKTRGSNEFSWIDVVASKGDISTLIDQFLKDEQKQRAEPTSQLGTLPSINPLTDDMITHIKNNPWEYFALVLDVKVENESSLLRSINQLLNQAKTKATIPSMSERKNFDRILAEEDLVDSEVFMDTGIGNTDLIIESIMSTRTNNLSTQHVQGCHIPKHQFLGGGTAEFSIKGKCLSKTAKERLEALKLEFDRRCHLTFSGPSAGSIKNNPDSTPFVRVVNEVFQLMGVDFVMPVSLRVDSIPEQPNVWEFEMALLEFNPKTQASERVKFLETTLQTQAAVLNYQAPGDLTPDPLIQKAQEYFSLEDSLKSLEILPDMGLPTKTILDKWIDIIREEAIYRKINKVPRPKSTLSATEAEVVDHLEHFFQNNDCLTIMSHFKERDTTKRTSYTGSFVDPDFYFFYDPNKTWGALLDKLAMQEFGRRLPGFSSDKVEENGLEAFYQEFSPLFGTTTMFSSDYLSSRASTTEDELISAAKNSYPPSLAKQAHDATMSQVEGAKFEQYPGAWWTTPTNVSPVDETKTFEDSNPEYLKGPYINPNVKVSAFDSNAANTGVTPAEFDGSLEEFLSIAWRRKRAEVNTSYALKDSNIRLNGGSGIGFASKDGISFYKSLINSGFLFTAQPVSTYSAIGGSVGDFGKYNYLADNLPMDASYISARLNGVLPVGGKSLKEIEEESKIALLQTGHDDLVSEWGYIPRSIHATRKYAIRYGGTEIVATPLAALGATTTEALVNTQDMFNSIAGKYRIDPNIARAFFLRRTGFGTIKNETVDSNGVGFGDLSVDIASKLSNAEQVELFCEKFRRNLDRLNNVPTLALAATVAQLTYKGRALYVTGTDGIGTSEPGGSSDKFRLNKQTFYNVLKEAASKLNSPETKFSIKGAEIITNALAKTALASDIDTYWTAYIEVCRVLGSVRLPGQYLSKVDAYFDPFNALILTDSETNTEYANTSLTPSGNKIRVSMSRGEVTQTTADIQVLGDPNNPVSAEQDAELRVRLKFGLEPHSEASAWGSMFDCRRYSVFGRFVQAYPSFCVLLVNEGFYFAEGSVKLWDQFYTRAGITNIEVFKSRKDPAHSCSVTYSNMFYSISRYTQMEALRQEIAVDSNNRFQSTFGLGAGTPLESIEGALRRFWAAAISKEPDPRLLKTWATNHLNQLALTAGARIQVRMGYGSNASTLPVVFNGTIIDAPIGGQGEVTIKAAGDGFELNNPVTDRLVKVDNGFAYRSQEGFLGAGTEPSQIVVQSMIPNSMFVAALTQGRYGVTRVAPHFGEIIFGGTSYSIPEVMMNMYGASRKHLSQSFNFIKNTFNKNALYNWDDTTLISVSVHEPTVWKTAQVCAQAVMDYVTSPEPFHTRSTLFFGRWWYPFNYAYSPSILGQNNVSSLYTASRSTTANSVPSIDGSTPRNTSPKGFPTQEAKGVELKFEILPDGPFKETLENEKNVATLVDLNVFDKKEDTATIIAGVAGLFGQSLAANLLAELKKKYLGSDEKAKWGFGIFNPKNGGPTYALVMTLGDDGILRTQKLKDFTYTPSSAGAILTTNDQTIVDNADPTMLRDVENFVKHLYWKPYIQAWPAVTGLNLLSNNIVPSQKDVYTDAKGQHTFNGWISRDTPVKTITYCVDSDISPSTRRTMLVDTGLLVTTVQRGFTNTVAKGAANIANSVLGWTPWTPVISEFINETPDTPAIENSVVNALCNSVKEMYQGWFSISGQSAMKPNDLVLLNDAYNGMEGPVFIGDVIHRMDSSTGFVTLISPDCVALPHSAIIGQRLIVAHSSGPLAKAGQYVIGSAAWAAMAFSLKKLSSNPFSARILELKELTNRYTVAEALGSKNLTNTVKTQILSAIDARMAAIAEASKKGLFSSLRIEQLKKTRQAIEASENLSAVFLYANESGINVGQILRDIPGVSLDFERLVSIIHNSQNLYIEMLRELKANPATSQLSEQEIIRLVENKVVKQLNQTLIDADLAVAGDSATDGLSEISALLRNESKLRPLIDPGTIQVTDEVIEEAWAAARFKAATSPVRLVNMLKGAEVALSDSVRLRRATKLLSKSISGLSLALSAIGPGVIARLAFEVVRFSIGQTVIQGINSRLMARQAVKIFPLRSIQSNGTSIPFVAGIRGHQGAVVGDDPGYFDKLLSGKFEPSIPFTDGLKLSFILSALLGVEIPEYGNTDVDNLYIQKMKEVEDKRVNGRR